MFLHFQNYLPLKKDKAVYLNLNPLHPRMHCAKIAWNWPSGSWEEDFLNLSMYFYNFVIISPRKRSGPSFEQIWIPSSQEYFVPCLIEIGLVVIEKKIFLISQFRNYFPLKKRGGPSFEQTWIPSNQGCFVPSFVEIGPVVLEQKIKMGKVIEAPKRVKTVEASTLWGVLEVTRSSHYSLIFFANLI